MFSTSKDDQKPEICVIYVICAVSLNGEECFKCYVV